MKKPMGWKGHASSEVFSKAATRIIMYCIALGGLNTVQAQQAPEKRISNGVITADIYLPDHERGYYRATRFDWSGVIHALEFKGHQFFGQWFDNYDPYLHDAITGPVESFEPLGFQRKSTDGTFTKIGVGLLKKNDTTAYHFSQKYQLVEPGDWHIQAGSSDIKFVHSLESGDYPYQYTKTLKLKGSKLIIDHKLVNTGKRSIDTQVFNHNFFVFDDTGVGPGYVIRFPFHIDADTEPLGDFAVVEGGEIRVVKPLSDKDRIRLRSILGYSNASGYRIEVENSVVGTGVRISCDRPLSNLIFWAASKTVCPEPYIRVKADPNESFTWTITYDYYTL